jgi:uncharacterized protein YbaP (TraB family)
MFQAIRAFILFFTLLFCAAINSYAQERTAHTLLWEITKDGIETKSYLYGTIHVRDKRVFGLSDSILAAIHNSKLFVAEALVDEDEVKKLLPHLLLPPEIKLQNLIGKRDYKVLVEILKSKNMGIYRLVIKKMKPLLVATLLEESAMPKDKQELLDEHLQTLAKNKKIPIIGLETAQEQMSAIDSIPLDEQTQMLKAIIEERRNNKVKPAKDKSAANDYETLLSLYLSQNIDALSQLANKMDTSERNNFSKYLLDDRNTVMAERIAKITDEQPTFIAIGAAHLGGANGVITLLRKRNYQVRPIQNIFKK